ncbi:MAG TPA: choice-of-anchor tandem repeat GloVer-containing protein [Terriglobales bacterium]|nr:choice-of-anchor tandem repeat GloVer-containing protein [Terriglobales bacterium]
MHRTNTFTGFASGVSGGVQIANRKHSFVLRTALMLAALTLPVLAQNTAPKEVVLHTWVETSTKENGGSFAGMTIDAAGNLYGATFGTEACSVGCGSVFKLVKQAGGGFRYQTLHNFKGGLAGDGSNPFGAPILDSAGNIYGTTMGGGFGLQSGVVYKLTPTGNGEYTESVLHEFGAFGTNDGSEPFSTLAFDGAGNLYGTTNQGGGGVGGTFCLNGCGTVFKLSPSADGTWTESVIHSFPGTPGNTDGQNPHGGVVFDSKGNLWGTTENGGNMQACLPFADFTGCGTVFELTPQPDGTWTESFLLKFDGESTGFNPWDGLVIDAADNLYGMVTNGGGGNGAVFKLTPRARGGVTEAIIHPFTVCGTTCTDGANPFNGLTLDAAGNLYGTTDLGGGGGSATGSGTVFKLTPNSNGTYAEHILHRFTGGRDGGAPQDDRVAVDSNGNVFGTTLNGGDIGFCPLGCGVVFEIQQ